MKKRNIIVLATIMVIGCGVFYAVDSGYVRFGIPAQADTNTSISEASEPQKMEHQPISSVAQTDLNAQAQQPKPTPPQPREAKKEVLKASASSAPDVSKAVAVTGIAFGKTNDLTLNIGNTNRRSATTTPAGQAVTYASGDPTVATVAADGTVTCLAVGKTEITAKSGGVTASYNLTVAAAPAPVPATSAEQAQVSGNNAQKIDPNEYALEVIRLVNEKRESVGLATLEIDSDLMAHAEIRAEELSIQFSHTRPDGTKETSECAHTGAQTPQGALNAWIKSDPHRNAILNENGKFNYKFIGAGCYQAENGQMFWVLSFSRGDTSSGGETSLSDANNFGGNSNLNSVTYSLNATNLSLTAGEGYQLSVEPADDDAQVAWSAPSLADGILSVDDSGYVTTYYRDGMTSAKATITVSAKVTAPGKSTKTLHCKIIVTQ